MEKKYLLQHFRFFDTTIIIIVVVIVICILSSQFKILTLATFPHLLSSLTLLQLNYLTTTISSFIIFCCSLLFTILFSLP